MSATVVSDFQVHQNHIYNDKLSDGKLGVPMTADQMITDNLYNRNCRIKTLPDNNNGLSNPITDKLPIPSISNEKLLKLVRRSVFNDEHRSTRCLDYMRVNVCLKEKCKLLHRLPKETGVLCYHFIRGYCANDNCIFLHMDWREISTENIFKAVDSIKLGKREIGEPADRRVNRHMGIGFVMDYLREKKMQNNILEPTNNNISKKKKDRSESRYLDESAYSNLENKTRRDGDRRDREFEPAGEPMNYDENFHFKKPRDLAPKVSSHKYHKDSHYERSEKELDRVSSHKSHENSHYERSEKQIAKVPTAIESTPDTMVRIKEEIQTFDDAYLDNITPIRPEKSLIFDCDAPTEIVKNEPEACASPVKVKTELVDDIKFEEVETLSGNGNVVSTDSPSSGNDEIESIGTFQPEIKVVRSKVKNEDHDLIINATTQVNNLLYVKSEDGDFEM